MFQEIILAGNISDATELRHAPNGNAYTIFCLDVNNRRAAKVDRDRVSEHVRFEVIIWGDKVKRLSRLLVKGKFVIAIGIVEEPTLSLDKDGKPQAALRVTADEVRFAGRELDDAN